MGPTALVLVKGLPVAVPGDPGSGHRANHPAGESAGCDRRDRCLHQPGRPLGSPDGHASVIVVTVRKNTPIMHQMNVVPALRSVGRGAVPGATVQVGG
jgi:hypothetical protein